MSNKKQAIRALKNAQTRAAKKADPAKQAATLRAGMTTAISWLDGTNPKAS
jgi:hypothetical protein